MPDNNPQVDQPEGLQAENPQMLLGRRRRRDRDSDRPLVRMALRRLQNEVGPEDRQAIEKVLRDDDAVDLIASRMDDGMNRLEDTSPIDPPGRPRGAGIIAFLRELLPFIRELLPLIKEISGMLG